MSDTRRVMLLIDADNPSGDVIEQAVQRTLAQYGSIHIRRAYCGMDKALTHQALFKRLLVRPMVNLSAGKNSTDIALAVDAMDLAVSERPDVVVLVSSDSDFAPLVIRLREKGCHVCGIGQQGKTGEETAAVYDEFVDLKHQPARAAPVKQTARAPAPRRAAASRARAVQPPAPALPEEAQRILDALPDLRSGQRMELNQAAEGLRAANLLGRRASSPKLFKKFPQWFLLTPDNQPSKVQYLFAK
ncbi:MAG TPA: NYN domain-containing protein [Ramlibacter sp.]|nr:NYN domain-containing protein [Ramlibacter sp.]